MGGFGICWWFHEQIFAIMQKPIMEALAKHHLDAEAGLPESHRPLQHVPEDLAAGGTLRGIAASCSTRCGRFIAPGLYRNERRYVLPFMFSTVGLFLAGGYFGYRMVYPAALDFLIGFSGQFQPMITVGEYTDLFLTIIAGLGIVFEMPILVFFLALMGIVSAGWMWRNFRYSILVIFIIAGIITPTPDIMNMCIFAAPMIVLYLRSASASPGSYIQPNARSVPPNLPMLTSCVD